MLFVSFFFGEVFPLKMLKVKYLQLLISFLVLGLTVTLRKTNEAAGTGVAVVPSVVWLAEAATGQILAGSISKLHLTVTG